MLRRAVGRSAGWHLYASAVIFFLNPSPARAQLTPIAHPSAFSNHPQLLVTFFGLEQQYVPEQNGVKFTHNGLPARLGFDCLPHPYGPTRCTQAGLASDEDLFNQGPAGAPLEIQLPFLTTRAAFEVAFHVHGPNQFTVVTFLRGDTVVGTANTPAWSDTGRYNWFFVGWESTEPFDRIRLTPPWVAIALDNLRVDASERFTLLNASSGFGGYTGLELPDFPVTSVGDIGLHQAVPPQGDQSLNGCCGGTQGFVYNRFPGLVGRPIVITFPRPVTRVGLTLGGPGGEQPGNAFLVTLMRGTEVVGSLAVPQQGPGAPPLLNAPFWAIEGPKFTKILLQHMQDRINIDDVSWAYAPPEPSCGDGAVIVGEQCDDGNNVNGDGCSSICKVEDVPGNQAPVAACTADQSLNVEPAACGASFSINAGSFDPDGDPLSVFQLPPFLPLDMSTGVSRREAFLGVSDPYGARASCVAVVHLSDRRPPSVSCPTQVLECGSGGGVNVTAASVQSEVFAYDSCQMRSMSCGPSSVFYLLGTNKTEFGEKITCTASDWTNNAALCSPTIEVRDTLPPVVTCERAPQNGSFYTVSATDQCTGVAQLTLGGIPVNAGETIMVTRGGTGADVRVVGPETGKVPRHFILGRDAPFAIVATDGTNKATAVCPPIR